MRVVCRIQREALGESLEKASVVGPCMSDHGCVRLQRNINRRYGVLLCSWTSPHNRSALPGRWRVRPRLSCISAYDPPPVVSSRLGDVRL